MEKKSKRKTSSKKEEEEIEFDDSELEDEYLLKDMPPPQLKTSNNMTIFEYSRVLTNRINKLYQGREIPLVDPNLYNYRTLDIARAELDGGLLDSVICRILPDGTKEFIEVNKMKFPKL